MLLPLDGLDLARLEAALEKWFGASGSRLEFQPLGEDSWAYRYGQMWVSVRRDLRGHNPNAYQAARMVRDHGFEFVVAPILSTEGTAVQTFDGHPVIAFPFLTATPLSAFSPSSTELRAAVTTVEAIHRYHGPLPSLPLEDFSLPFEAELECSVAEVLDGHQDRGPLSNALRSQLIANRDFITSLRTEIRQVAEACRSDCEDMSSPYVFTHGEPSAPNLVRCDGQIMVVDWGGASMAPPERDWFHVRRTFDIEVPGRAKFLEFYNLRWQLSEIAEYLEIFSREHTGSAEDLAMWQRLQHYLPAGHSVRA